MAYEMQPTKGFADPVAHTADARSQTDDRLGVDASGLATGTDADAWDMARMGRKQELRRNFKSLSVLGLATTTMSTWVAMLLSSVFSLTNGGLAGTVWIYVASWLSIFTVAASLAEMASMAPHSGGQYREFQIQENMQLLNSTDVTYRLGLGIWAPFVFELPKLYRRLAGGSRMASPRSYNG